MRLRAFGLVKIWNNRSIGIIYGTSVAAWTWQMCTSSFIPPVRSAVIASILGPLFYAKWSGSPADFAVLRACRGSR